MEHWLPRLRLPRPGDLHRNPDRETSYLSLTWMEFEFKSYCQGRRVGIAAGESRLLELLSAEPAWRVAAGPYWPDSGSVFFHQVRDDGRNLDANLDLIKEDLRAFIEQNRLDTLFLSLGGGAKVLCYELSGECDICAFDFGAMLLRADVQCLRREPCRTSDAFAFFVPRPVRGVHACFGAGIPEPRGGGITGQNASQLLLDVQFKEPGWTHTAFEYDFSEENRAGFGRRIERIRPAIDDLAAFGGRRKREKGFLAFLRHARTHAGRTSLLCEIHAQIRHPTGDLQIRRRAGRIRSLMEADLVHDPTTVEGMSAAGKTKLLFVSIAPPQNDCGVRRDVSAPDRTVRADGGDQCRRRCAGYLPVAASAPQCLPQPRCLTPLNPILRCTRVKYCRPRSC